MDLSLKTLPPSSGRQKEIRRVNNFVSCKVLPADFTPPGSAHFQYLHSGQWCVSRAADTVCSRFLGLRQGFPLCHLEVSLFLPHFLPFPPAIDCSVPLLAS